MTRPPTPAPVYVPCPPSDDDWTCCTGSKPCRSGDGDCDSDSDCEQGLRCIDDVGDRYGGSNTLDVCLGVGDICPPSANDANCCGKRGTIGRRRLSHGRGSGWGSGWGSGFGSGGFMSGYICRAGEGGCQMDDDCAPGLDCNSGKGRRYGSTLSYMGVCEVPAGLNSRR